MEGGSDTGGKGDNFLSKLKAVVYQGLVGWRTEGQRAGLRLRGPRRQLSASNWHAHLLPAPKSVHD